MLVLFNLCSSSTTCKVLFCQKIAVFTHTQAHKWLDGFDNFLLSQKYTFKTLFSLKMRKTAYVHEIEFVSMVTGLYWKKHSYNTQSNQFIKPKNLFIMNISIIFWFSSFIVAVYLCFLKSVVIILLVKCLLN